MKHLYTFLTYLISESIVKLQMMKEKMDREGYTAAKGHLEYLGGSVG